MMENIDIFFVEVVIKFYDYIYSLIFREIIF